MSLLYRGLEDLMKKVDMLAPQLTDLPIISSFTNKWIWLGDLSDIVEVELKLDKKTAGWLYNTTTILFFTHKDYFYECWCTALKEIAEDKLKEKKFVDIPQSNHIVRDNKGRITGYLSIEDLVAISNKIDKPKQQEG